MPKFRHLIEWEASPDGLSQIGRFRGNTVAALRLAAGTMITVSVKGQRLVQVFGDIAEARFAAQRQFEILQNGHLKRSGIVEPVAGKN